MIPGKRDIYFQIKICRSLDRGPIYARYIKAVWKFWVLDWNIGTNIKKNGFNGIRSLHFLNKSLMAKLFFSFYIKKFEASTSVLIIIVTFIRNIHVFFSYLIFLTERKIENFIWTAKWIIHFPTIGKQARTRFMNFLFNFRLPAIEPSRDLIFR